MFDSIKKPIAYFGMMLLLLSPVVASAQSSSFSTQSIMSINRGFSSLGAVDDQFLASLGSFFVNLLRNSHLYNGTNLGGTVGCSSCVGMAPVISNISSGSPTTTAATITWTTDRSSNSKVVYGTTSAYGSASSSAPLVTSHSISLINLFPETTYHFAVVSTGSLGNTSTSSDQTFTTSGPIFNLWFHSDANISTFLQSSHPGINILSVGDLASSSSILSGGYNLMSGLGGYASAYAQGQDPNTGASQPTYVAYIENIIAADASAGVKWIYVDEPWPAPGESTAQSTTSIAYNVIGYNILYNYIHTNYPGVNFGLTTGDDGGAPLHLAMLQAGLHEDFSSEEEYNQSSGTSSPFVTDGQKALYPNVKTMLLAYSTFTLCQNNGQYPGPAATSGFDILAFWDVDLYGGWIQPMEDASFLTNAETYAQTGQTSSFCTLPLSMVPNHFWTDVAQTSPSFTFPISDAPLQTPSPYTLASCDYMVISGPNAINGPNDPGNVITRNWTPRTCNSDLTITVGAGQDCRDNGTFTCLVFVRGKTTSGAYDNETYQQYSISY